MVESSFLKHLKNVLLIDVPEIAETSLENKLEEMNYPISLGNESGQCSSLPVCLPPNLSEFQVINTIGSSISSGCINILNTS